MGRLQLETEVIAGNHALDGHALQNNTTLGFRKVQIAAGVHLSGAKTDSLSGCVPGRKIRIQFSLKRQAINKR